MEVIKRFWILILVVIGGVFFLYNYVLDNIEQKKILYGGLPKSITQ